MLRVARCTVAAGLATLALSGCRDSFAPSTAMRGRAPSLSIAAADLEPRIVWPLDTDQAIDWTPALRPEEAYHQVWLDLSVESNDKLLLFMPGTNNKPTDYDEVQKEAARLGYHVIGLMYQNDVGVDARCKGSSDEDCSGDMRLEILTGEATSDHIAVSPANSIDNRLAKLLALLSELYPSERWSRFLHDGAPKWSQIAVAGQSQGAGQAALIAKLRHVSRVVLLSGPPDARVLNDVDRWVSIGRTPASKYFALYHRRDQFLVTPGGTSGIRANLTALDMDRFGDPVLVAGGEAEYPYGGTHILETDLQPQGGYANPRPHQSTARDVATPLPSGCTAIGPSCAPLLIHAWRYLLGEFSAADDE